jgi:hypothetical protein
MCDPLEIFERWLVKKPRLWRYYMALNPCKETYADGREKPESLAFKLFTYVFYLKCSCCSAIRGLVIGFILGLAAGVIWCQI